MSTAVESLKRLLAGEPAIESLLPACRTWAFGVEAFGGAMAAEVFACQPNAVSPHEHVVQTEQNLAIFDVDEAGCEQAIFADLFDGRIGRLWRLGRGTLADAAEPALFVAFDPVMSQVRSDVAFSIGDHPELDPLARTAVVELASLAAHADGDQVQRVVEARAFVVRAFTAEDRGAALFHVEQTTGGAVRERRSFYVASAFRFSAIGVTHHRRVADAVQKLPPRFTL